MNDFNIFSYKTNKPLFGGTFKNITECLETAINKGIDLSHAELSNINLSNANLDDAQMPHANFNNANLSGTNLSESNLKGANFTNTSLYNTCLAYSDLSACRFEHSAFGATDITGARLSHTLFSGLSCFSLDFIEAGIMQDCIYKDRNGKTRPMSQPPIVIKGLNPRPLIFFNHPNGTKEIEL